jgi:RNA polymerase sigma factor (sigma-70 family)
MPTSPANRLIDQLLLSVPPGDGERRADGELLTRFVESRDEVAFAALVRRHGPLVWGVCIRALHNHQDAEDAFQATFLVLVRKAASVSPREMVANWLYGVAHQATLQARRTIARRRGRELQVTEMPDAPAAEHALAPDVQSVLDEELVHLPDIYRAVVVLCDLEGRTRREVARQLGVPDGTVGGRLARARAMLAKRLSRRGVTLPAGAVATALSHHAASAGVPSLVVSKAIKATTLVTTGQATLAGTISGQVAALTEGVVKAMFVSKLKTAASAVFVLALMGTAAALLTDRTAVGQEDKKATAEKRVEPPAKQEAKVAAPVPKQAKEKEELTAWGKEAGGLQAGLSYQPGEKRVHRPGETVKLVVRVRNVGKEEVSFQYLRHFFIENPPTVTFNGKPVAFKDGSTRGIYKPLDVTLAPGKEIELYELSLTLADKAADPPQASTLYGEGKFQLQYERVLGDSMLSSVSIKTAAALRKLATGKLDLVVSRWIHRAAADENTRFLLDLLREANRQDDPKPPGEKPAGPGAKKQPDKEAFTAWGKEVGGLQVGLGFRPGERRAYHPGETAKLVVRVRNVGQEEKAFTFYKEFCLQNLPTVVNDKGKAVALTGVMPLKRIMVEAELPAGEEVEIGEFDLALQPPGESGNARTWTLYESGKFQIQFEKVDLLRRTGENSFGPLLDSPITTGKLELEVKVADGEKNEPAAACGSTTGAGARALAHWQGKWVLSKKLNDALGFTDAKSREGGLLDAPPLSFRVSLSEKIGDGIDAKKMQSYHDLVFKRMKHRIVATGKWEMTFQSDQGVKERDCFVTEFEGATYLWVPADYIVLFGGRVSFLEGADQRLDALVIDFNTTEGHLAGGRRSPDTFIYQREPK